MTDKPHFVFRDGMTADSNYVQWIADIKSHSQEVNNLLINCEMKKATKLMS